MTERTPCPPWCTTDHDAAKPGSVRETVHIAAEAHIWLPGAAYVRACAWWGGYESTDPDVFLNFGGERLSVSPEAACRLAVLVELLAGATKTQHRELAAAIRAAVGTITAKEADL